MVQAGICLTALPVPALHGLREGGVKRSYIQCLTLDLVTPTAVNALFLSFLHLLFTFQNIPNPRNDPPPSNFCTRCSVRSLRGNYNIVTLRLVRAYLHEKRVT